MGARCVEEDQIVAVPELLLHAERLAVEAHRPLEIGHEEMDVADSRGLDSHAAIFVQRRQLERPRSASVEQRHQQVSEQGDVSGNRRVVEVNDPVLVGFLKAPRAPAKRWLIASRSPPSSRWSASGPVSGCNLPGEGDADHVVTSAGENPKSHLDLAHGSEHCELSFASPKLASRFLELDVQILREPLLSEE